ncbi:MAG TPA: response regulator [Burkholderiaceae bacterium]|nr:response regulator [Burkholderiaceae bacterium]
MTIDDAQVDLAARREMLRLALHNAERSVPLQVAAVVVLAGIGWYAGRTRDAAVVAVLGLVVGLWRGVLGRRARDIEHMDDRDLKHAIRQLEGNAALAGLMWVVAAFGIYAHLEGEAATSFVVFACGSVSIAAFFMSLAGRSFLWLALPLLTSVIAATLLGPSLQGTVLAAMIAIYGATLMRVAREFTAMATRAVQHGLEVDAANAELQRAKDAADAANLAKSQFLATMSHEIRTPMNGVMGSLELLRHSTLDADQRRLVRTAMGSGHSLMGIVNDVLDHSKIEAGKLALVVAPFSLRALVGSVETLFRGNAQAKNLALRAEVDPGSEDWLIGDAQRLKQVLLNLVGNAIKFTEHGRVLLLARTEPRDGTRVAVLFEVEDSGLGIAADALPGLFQPFHQVGTNAGRRRGGTGLGLAISQRIVEAMGGRIAIKSQPGEGSRFSFTIVLERDPATEHAPQVDSVVGRLDGDVPLAGTVLVVEDNDVNRMVAHSMLRSLGLEVIEASNGRQALEQIARHPVDLVLMDCEMPVMDGYEATREIRRREAELALPRVPVLALTANAFDDDAVKSKAAGMDAHMAKPYSREQLKDLLETWM